MEKNSAYWKKVVDKAVESLCQINMADIEPIPADRYLDITTLPADEAKRFYDKGLEAIAVGRVAAMVLAGGQASRLDTDQPKGAFPLGPRFGPPSSLLYVHTARLNRLLQLAKAAHPNSQPAIPWIIMTSESTDAATKTHMKEVTTTLCDFPADSILYIRQSHVPTLDFDGNVLKGVDGQTITNPDGNGGVYEALRIHLPTLADRGVKYVHVFSVDNILNRPADPTFIGACLEKGADCAAKVVEKLTPDEAVGNLCMKSGRVRIVEYSEITPELAERRDPATGRLFLRAGSIANHVFSIDFLCRVCAADCEMPFHAARKKVKHVDPTTSQLVVPTQPNAYKLERFIFDSFEYAKNFLAYQVDKSDEFSPLKNSNDVGKECLTTCLYDLSTLHKKWMKIRDEEKKNRRLVFLDPAVSYGGEDVSDPSQMMLIEYQISE